MLDASSGGVGEGSGQLLWTGFTTGGVNMTGWLDGWAGSMLSGDVSGSVGPRLSGDVRGRDHSTHGTQYRG